MAITCETESSGRLLPGFKTSRPADPIMRGKNLECGPNTRNLSLSLDKEHSDLGKDSTEKKHSDLEIAIELAYSSFKYATAGQYDKAFEVAQTINNADFKARALAMIAIKLAEQGQHDKALEATKTIEEGSSKKMALDAIARYQKSP